MSATRRDREEDEEVKITGSTSPQKPQQQQKKVFPIFASSKAQKAAAATATTSDNNKEQQQNIPRDPIAEAAAANATPGQLNLKQYITDPEWTAALGNTFELPYFKKIEDTLAADEKAKIQVFPPRKDIFTALNVCPLSKVKVVIIGQDPYHDNNQAHGLCFSVLPGVKTPPSLVNMYKELKTDIPGFQIPAHGYLIDWAKQGILMLNATLTVQAHKANSHEKIGWQIFTDKIIDLVNERKNGKPVIFMLWGNFAIKKAKRVDRKKHRVIENAHPSPLSATKWFGCKCFSKCNDALKELGEEPINWMLPVAAPTV